MKILEEKILEERKLVGTTKMVNGVLSTSWEFFGDWKIIPDIKSAQNLIMYINESYFNNAPEGKILDYIESTYIFSHTKSPLKESQGIDFEAVPHYK